MYEEIGRQAVAAYKPKWSKREVDAREWEHKVNECGEVGCYVKSREKQHVLGIGKHIRYLHDFKSKYVCAGRFIGASSKCSTKSLLKNVLHVRVQ